MVPSSLLSALAAAAAGPTDVRPLVACEEVVTTVLPADNGAGPLWCYGSPLIVRQGDTVWASTIETGTDVPPLCNTRWQLWQRDAARRGWRMVAQEDSYRQREPCPLVGLGDGQLFLSSNPSTQPPGTRYGPCEPTVVRFGKADGVWTHGNETPAWSDGTWFTDHSYRGLAADAERGELLLLNIHARSSAQFVSHRDAGGRWHARGKLTFPIRAAYPQVALRHGAAHVLAIGDIQEPVPEWRKLKYQHLGREWDYVFRRLFYTCTPDLEKEPFADPLEVDTVEETGGHITNLDLHIDALGTAHLLYLKQPHVHAFLRDRYFPGWPMTRQLEYVTIHAGQVQSRRTLCQTPRGDAGLEPAYGRFHVGLRETLSVVVAGTRTDPDGSTVLVNAILSPATSGPVTELPLEHPFRTFFTSTPRGGGPPAADVDLFGQAEDSRRLRYAHVRLLPPQGSSANQARF
jgi:hypothetical protein